MQQHEIIASIIILQYNKIHLTIRCLESIEKYEDVNLISVHLVDNASPEGDEFDRISKRFPWVTLHRNEKNLGFAKGVNKIAREIESEFMFLVNNDIVLINDAISKCLALLRKKELAATTPIMLNGDGRMSGNFSVSPISPIALVLMNLCGINRLLIKVYQCLNYSGPIGYANGGFLGMRSSVFKNVGYFSEQYFMYTEDTDLMIKFHKHNAKMMLCAEAKVVHYHGSSSSEIWKKEELKSLQISQLTKSMRDHYSGLSFLFFRIYALIKFRVLV